MQRYADECVSSRAGEIIVVSPGGAEKEMFLQAVCANVYSGEKDLLVGILPINRELILYCYGITYDRGFAWDLVGRKMLGYVAVFDWFDDSSYAACREAITFTSASFSAPFVIAANLGLKPPPVPESAIRPNIPLSPHSKFLFFQSHKPATVKKVIITLLDVLLEKLE